MLRSIAKYFWATGPVAAASRSARAGSVNTLMIPSARGWGATLVKSPAPVAPEKCLVVAEVGRHDRAAGGEIHGDLALHRVILAARQPRMNQDVGAAGERHHLLGRLAGQHDQPIAVGRRAGPDTPRRLRQGRRPERTAPTGQRQRREATPRSRSARPGWDGRYCPHT